MTLNRYSRKGWHGNSQGHAMAAKGIRLYAKKSTPVMVDPLFYARREKQVPLAHLMDMVKDGKTYPEIKQMHPDADSEDIRLRGIKAYEMGQGTNTLSTLDKQGVDATVRMSENDKTFKEKVNNILNDHQAMSFLPSVKVMSLKERLK